MDLLYFNKEKMLKKPKVIFLLSFYHFRKGDLNDAEFNGRKITIRIDD